MNKYKILWSETLYYEEIIEAEDEDEAQVKFSDMDLGYDKAHDAVSGDYSITEIK